MSTQPEGPARGQALSPEQIEARIAARRASLAATVDELAYRAQPKQIARRGVADARRGLTEATRTPDGQLRTERIAAVAAAVVALVAAVALLRRRRARRRD
jgi:hypothetical protein